jgi:hypothetical protein
MPKKKKKKGNWIQNIMNKPGALHKALGVPIGKKIPTSKTTDKKTGKLGKILDKFKKKKK